MLSKPYGKCSSCPSRSKCCVETETLAKVIECPYPEKFYRSAQLEQKKDAKSARKQRL